MLKFFGGALGSVLGSIFGNLISGLFGWFRERRMVNDAKKQGQTEQANVGLTAALKAEQRMDEAAAKPVDTEKELRDGTF